MKQKVSVKHDENTQLQNPRVSSLKGETHPQHLFVLSVHEKERFNILA